MADQIQQLLQEIEALRRENARLEALIADTPRGISPEPLDARILQVVLDTMDALVVVLDPEGRIYRFNRACEQATGYTLAEVKGESFWGLFLAPEEVDKVKTSLAALLSNGYPIAHVNDLVTRHGERRLIAWSDAVSGCGDGEAACIIGTGIDITAWKRAEEDLRQSVTKLQRSLDGTVTAMSFAVEMRDPFTAGHQKRVSMLACEMARWLGMPEEDIEVLRIAGLLHDIGKIVVPAEILSKPTRLSQAEFTIIQAHTQVGYDILKGTAFSPEVALVALQHHERLDGSGYPNGLVAEEIIEKAQILAVADVLEAMASHRPYRPGLGIHAALQEIMQHRGTRYAAHAVDACLQVMTELDFDLDLWIAKSKES